MRKMIAFSLVLSLVTLFGCSLDEPGISDPYTPDTGDTNTNGDVTVTYPTGACCVETENGGSCSFITSKECKEVSDRQGNMKVFFNSSLSCSTEVRERCQSQTSSGSPTSGTRCCVEGQCLLTSNKETCEDEKDGTAYSSLSSCQRSCGDEITTCCSSNGSCIPNTKLSECFEMGGDPKEKMSACRETCQPEKSEPVGACCTDLEQGVCKTRKKGNCPSNDFFYKGKTCSDKDVVCDPEKRLSACCAPRKDAPNRACHNFSYSKCLSNNGTPYESTTSCAYSGCTGGDRDVVCLIHEECRDFPSVEHCRKIGGEAYDSEFACRKHGFTHACCLNQTCHESLTPEECKEAGGFSHSGGERSLGCTEGVTRQCEMMTTMGACCHENSQNGNTECERRSEWACSGESSSSFHQGESCQDVSC